jgi:hypothetical protein
MKLFQYQINTQLYKPNFDIIIINSNIWDRTYCIYIIKYITKFTYI